MRINMRIKRMWICAMRMDMRINRMYNDPHRHIAILARHGLAVVGWQRDSMDHIQELRANLLAVIQLRQAERDMFQSNDRTVENSITNIQVSGWRAISEKVRQLRHSNNAGKNLLHVINREEDEVLAFGRRHARDVERKTINNLQQLLNNL